MNRTARGIAAGTVGGLGATLLMSAVMLAARKSGFSARLPPDRIAEKAIEESTDREATQDEERIVASIGHLAFGAIAGATFGGLASRLHHVPGALLALMGAIYGTGIWLISYQGWVPGLDIMPPADRDHRGRVATMVVGHWVYGASLGLLTAVLGGAFRRAD